MNTTEPYSPRARAKAKAKPVSSGGIKGGNNTRRNVCQRLAPSVAAASSNSGSNSSSTGCTVRTTNGKPVKISTNTMPNREYAPAMPSGTRYRPNQPLGTYKLEYTRPATAVGKAKGRSTRASNSRLSGNE